MKHALTIVAMAAVWCGLVLFGMAEDRKSNQSPDQSKVEARSQTAAGADLRAEIHRTLAALIEARSAEKPDQAKVDELSQKLQQLRGKLRAQNPAVAGNASEGWVCPWGGPGMGFGGGRGCGWGGGGRGPGGGCGAGGGRGWCGGAGCGRGFGPGAGQGRAPGGAAFVDEDNDGICDNYELRSGLHK